MTSNLGWVRKRWPDYRTGDLHPFNEGADVEEPVTLRAKVPCRDCRGKGVTPTYFGTWACGTCHGDGEL